MSGTSRWPPDVLDAINAQAHAAAAFADAVIGRAPDRLPPTQEREQWE